MSDEIYKPPSDIVKHAHVNADKYAAMYKGSLEQPDIFWAVQSKRLDWFKKPTKIKHSDFENDVFIQWYEDGVLNASYNCIDRHVEAGRGNVTALLFEPDDPKGESKSVSYSELLLRVSKLANAMRELGVVKGDRVIIYMPMILEATYAMLACARIGAVHSVVFGGFSADALAGRIEDCQPKLMITADEGLRGGKAVPLKTNVDEALNIAKNSDIKTLVYKHTGGNIEWDDARNIWWHEFVEIQAPKCHCEEMNAEDPLFILYTSGSTGKPKGVLHTTGGYMVWVAMTHEVVFDYKQGEIYWCTADVGWVTGHSYIVYGPLANGATSLVFEGVPSYPDYSRFWQIVDKYKVNIFYTAPTAIRALLKQGDEWLKSTSRKSLRILGTVGEPINHEAWLWYYNMIGGGNCPIVDTWWQTETGGHMMTPLPGATDMKPGSACQPFFGVKPAIVDGEGNILEGAAEGNFVILDSWPGQMRSIYGDHERFKQTYFTTFPGMYFTGDGAKRDKDGYYWITGRVDDVINVSGHRFGTAEIESAINEHSAVAESAVVGYPHDVKGQGIYAYVILNEGRAGDDDIKAEIIKTVRKMIGPIASPDVVHFTPDLPKTRSGKIMRRILRKIAANELDSLGDISTLADPDVVGKLIAGK